MRLTFVITLALVLCGWTHGQFIVGNALVNGFDTNCSAYPFINYILCIGPNSITSGTYPFPGLLNANMYPADTSSLGVTITAAPIPIPSGVCVSTAPCILDWQGTQGTSGSPGVELSFSGATVNDSSSICGNSGQYVASTSGHVSTYGTNGCIEFYNSSALTQFTLSFLSGACFGTSCSGGTASLSNLRLYLKSNYTNLQAGGIFNPDFLTALRTLNPKTIRFSDWDGYNYNATSGLGTPVGSLGYLNGYWDPTKWAGSIDCGANCSSDTYTATLAGATLTDGQAVQGQIITGNTTNSPTLNVNGLGAVPVYTMSGAAAPSGTLAANANSTFIYDAILNYPTGAWLYESGPLHQEVPLSVIVALCNQLYVGLWYNIPPHIALSDNGTALATYVKANLSSGLTFYPEVGDEWWNFTFPPTTWAQNRALALGIANSNGPYNDYYGLRFQQIMSNITAIWNGATAPKLVRVLAFGVAEDSTEVHNQRLEGSRLCGTSCSNSTYQTIEAALTGCSGTACDHDVLPNRPVDYADALSYAIYNNGAILNSGSYTGAGETSAYGTFSITGYVAGNQLVVTSAGTGTPTIGQGIATCDGTYITAGSSSPYTLNNTSCSIDSSGSPGTITGNDLLGMQYAADNYCNAVGTCGAGWTALGLTVLGSLQDAYNWIDSDARVGLIDGYVAGSTLQAYSQTGGLFNYYSTWTTIANDFSLPIDAYEGLMQDVAPTTTQCAAAVVADVDSSLGTNKTVYCGSSGVIQTVLNAYKNTPTFYQLTLSGLNNFVANSPTGSVPAEYTFCYPANSNQWSLCNGNLYGGWFQNYYALESYNHGFLLQGDLHRNAPANDNDDVPVGLNKAA